MFPAGTTELLAASTLSEGPASSLLELLSTSLILGIWDWDVRQQKLWRSSGLNRILGIPTEELRMPSMEMVEPDDLERVKEQLAHSIAHGPLRLRTRIRRESDGAIRSVEVAGHTEHDDTGRPVRMGGVVIDVTESRLEIGPTAELQARLRHAEHARALGVVASGMAHDFHNSLMVMRSIVESMKAADWTQLMELVAELDACIETTTAVTYRITHSSSSASQREELELLPLVDREAAMLRRLVPRSVKLSVRGSNLLKVYADARQLRLVLMNLVLNACAAMDGRGEVAIALSHDASGPLPNGRALIEVADTGPGVPHEIREKIFEPFCSFRSGGAGLGLATSRRIAQEHEGTLTLLDLDRPGACFVFALPALGRGSTADTARHDSHGVASRPRTTSRSGQVLVIEDDPTVLRVTTFVLQQAGYVVVPIEDRSEALAVLETSPEVFRSVVLDLGLPGGLGEDLASELVSKWPDIRVVLISGLPATRFDESRLMGSAVFLQKPFSFDKLLDSL